MDPVLEAKTASQEPRRWNRYAYVLNNPLSNMDPDGRDVIYANDWAKRVINSARITSRGTNDIICDFEVDHSRSVTFDVKDLAAPPGQIRGGETDSRKTDPDKKPTEFRVLFNQEAIEKTNSDPDAVAIHEVVGHLGPDSERTQKEYDDMGAENREKDAQERTVQEIEQIPPADRPSLPKTHLQPTDNPKPPDV